METLFSFFIPDTEKKIGTASTCNFIFFFILDTEKKIDTASTDNQRGFTAHES
jgi:hypothetical protein